MPKLKTFAAFILAVAFAALPTATPAQKSEGKPRRTQFLPSPGNRYVATVQEFPSGAWIRIFQPPSEAGAQATNLDWLSTHATLVSDDDRRGHDYQPSNLQWTKSERFFVYQLTSQQGFSPWRKPFAVADTNTHYQFGFFTIARVPLLAVIQPAYKSPPYALDSERCVSDVQTEGRDTISFLAYDPARQESDGKPGIPVRIALGERIDSLKIKKPLDLKP